MDDPSTPSDKLDRGVIVTGLVVISGTIMVLLDTTIVNVALDTLRRELDTPLVTTQWVVTGYLLAVGVVIPVTGWAIDRFGAKTVWITAITLFTTGSVLCASAWSIQSLIAFRLLQGLGGGMLIPGGQTIIARAAGPERMGRAMSLIGVPMLLGPVLGPVLGGFIVQHVSWHWIFLINVPVGALAVWLAVRKLPAGGALAEPGRLDYRGLVLLSGGLVCLLYGLSEASARAGFAEWGVIGWLIAGAALVAGYVMYSLKIGPSSIVDVRLFANRTFASGSVAILLIAVGMFGAMLLLPLYYQNVRGEGAFGAGLLLAPQGLGAMVAMPLAGRITDRAGAGYVVPVGVVLALLGTAPYGAVGAETSYVWLALALFVRGLGFGAVMMPTIATSYSRLSKAAVSRGATTVSAIQQVGGSLGSALLVMVFTRASAAEFEEAGLSGADGGIDQMGSIPADAREAAAPLLANAFGQAFWVSFGLLTLILIPAYFFPRKRKARNAPPAVESDARRSTHG
ncbi:DHA2 family efflux MFS transporter permease subunit [Phytoactinopolyspora halotolerans]|uniref:DHA2 family efflux MFS transporter permease subunit n=2 Tax=Phytoactinopolyspora halotolerans TaxID=1981512 RepID=A0A6L9SB89_9ACTN|nr:DHA2 family efflux MFS transporter permease subunit [Phytoactinopolyspora halotolerans]